jgi:hypothetical protein
MSLEIELADKTYSHDLTCPCIIPKRIKCVIEISRGQTISKSIKIAPSALQSVEKSKLISF